MNRYLMVMLGAALGGLGRYLVGTAILQRFNARFPENVFPIGTLVVNVTGCFAIGVLMTLFVDRGDPNPNLRLLLVTGVLGGYTTFSAFSLDAALLYERGEFLGMALYVGGSVALALVGVFSGLAVMRALS